MAPGGRWLWLPPAAFLAGLLVAPLLRLLVEGGASSAADWAWWQDPHLRWRMAWSVLQALATCALVLGLGLPVAWVLARVDFAGRRWVLRVLMLPFVVPTLVAAMGVLALLGPRGWLGQAGWNLEDTPWLLLYGNLFFNLCVLVRGAVEALERVSAQRLAAARTLGATPWRAFWRIEWPAIAPAVASALCLVFLYCFAGFGLALVLGGQRYATVEVEIYTLVAHELQLAPAGVLAVWTLALMSAVALLHAGVARHLATPERADRVPRQPARRAALRLAVGGALAVLALASAAPLLALWARALAAGPAAWAVWTEPETLAALGNTLRFAGAALLLATALGLLHAFGARGLLLWRATAYLPLVVSPVTVAFGLLLLYPGWTASLALLVSAYALLAYPFVAQALNGALDSQPAHLLQAARSLGATPWRGFVRVTLPLVAPALRRGMGFAAATMLGEFAVTLFLSRPEWTTLTTLIYQRLGRPGAANLDAALVLACGLMALALLVFVCLEPRDPTEAPPDHA
ncbi:ABC transporter permease [Hydrogenophaga sp. OTU3427]|uniref:ABC transporter permease n=1 Tax=Hydrogenophaga sp. OTU3427 TaxID=3043856 RepID=UPI00313BB202